MATQRYSVTPHPIETLLTWVKSGEITIPEIQRPFVWDATKVRNLLDSLYQGYPVGYLIAWRNPSVRLKDGSTSSGKRILIDGQQRVTALMAALLGQEVLTKDYETVRIRIAFHPVDQRFEVSNPAIRKDSAWIAGSPETAFDFDIRQIEARGLSTYTDAVIDAELPQSFWITLLPQEMETSSATSPFFLVYQAAPVKLGDLGFLSRDITVRDLLLNRSDVHHIYPRNYLKKKGLTRGRYNQIANFVLAQSEINIAIGDKPPAVYFAELAEQCNGGPKKYGGIIEQGEMRDNLAMSCLPEVMLDGEIPNFGDFLEERRQRMAAKIKTYFEEL